MLYLEKLLSVKILYLPTRVSDPYNFDVDPDPDPDPWIHILV